MHAKVLVHTLDRSSSALDCIDPDPGLSQALVFEPSLPLSEGLRWKVCIWVNQFNPSWMFQLHLPWCVVLCGPPPPGFQRVQPQFGVILSDSVVNTQPFCFQTCHLLSDITDKVLNHTSELCGLYITPCIAACCNVSWRCP